MLLYKYQTGGPFNEYVSAPAYRNPFTGASIKTATPIPVNKADSEVYRHYLVAKDFAPTQRPVVGENVSVNSAGRIYPTEALTKYPDFAHTEGEDVYNVTRFAFTPFFGTNKEEYTASHSFNGPDKTPKPFPAGYDALPEEQKRAYLLEDVFKMYMAEPNATRETAWQQANAFLEKKIDPKLASSAYKQVGQHIEFAHTRTNPYYGFPAANSKEKFERLQSYYKNFTNTPAPVANVLIQKELDATAASHEKTVGVKNNDYSLFEQEYKQRLKYYSPEDKREMFDNLRAQYLEKTDQHPLYRSLFAPGNLLYDPKKLTPKR
jgi:hypothetical protein